MSYFYVCILTLLIYTHTVIYIFTLLVDVGYFWHEKLALTIQFI
jgi:hypothetical protein